GHDDAVDSASGSIDPNHFAVQLNTPVSLFDGLLDRFPHHPRSKPRVIEFVDQCLDSFLWRNKHAEEGCFQRKILDSLCSPFSFQLGAWNAPYLLGVGFKKRLKKPFAETIRYPLLEGVLLAIRKYLPFEVA